MTWLKVLLLSLLFLLNLDGLIAQDGLAPRNELNSIWLINGNVYYESNPFAKGSPYLYNDFVKANIYTCNQTFADIFINYDILDQKLVVLHSSSDGKKIPIEISQIMVDSFKVNDYVFCNTLKSVFPMTNPYVLVLNHGEVRMAISYKKDFIKSFSQNNEYGLISERKQSIYLMEPDRVTEIRSLKSFRKVYQSNWKQIKQYIKDNKLKLRKSTNSELAGLMKYCNSLN